MHSLARRLCAGLFVLSLSAAQADPAEDLRALLNLGSRETGTAGNARARVYLAQQFRSLGYDTREQPFTYTRYQDYGSRVRVGNVSFEARALQGSGALERAAPVAWVPGVGTAADFARAKVRGKIAVVMRGGMLFREKARHARDAGAVALIIVNTERGVYRGAIGEPVGLPVLSVAPEAKEPLRGARDAHLSVNLKHETVQGANLIASLPSAAPRVLFGAHHDSFIHSPGINDNASGVVGVLEVAREIQGTTLAPQALFVLFDGEEDRFHGSRAFVKNHPELLPQLKAMLNLDMIGVNAQPLAVGGSANLVRLARQAVPGLPSFSDSGLSDHESFIAANVPALLFFRGIDANYHLPSDTVASAALIQDTARAAIAVARAVLDH